MNISDMLKPKLQQKSIKRLNQKSSKSSLGSIKIRNSLSDKLNLNDKSIVELLVLAKSKGLNTSGVQKLSFDPVMQKQYLIKLLKD
jgi:hypothetical protein